MCKINLQTDSKGAVTIVSNVFIDRFMKDANGTYVKVYLYLLRCLSDSSVELSLSLLADKLEETEGDVIRALRYWEKVHVLSLRTNEDGEICDIALVDFGKSSSEASGDKGVHLSSAHQQQVEARKNKPSYSMVQLEQFKAYDDFNEVLNHIEELTGRTLTQKELQTPAFLFESLGFSGKLIAYAFDYCFEKGKKSFAYVDKVAIDWYEKGISTVDEAMKNNSLHSSEFMAVRKAFGINRDFGASELKHILHWCNDLCSSEELITEACNRTIIKSGKPSFSFANRILTDWSQAGIRTLEQAKAADEEFKAKAKSQSKRSASSANVIIPNKFNNYAQRQYSQEELDAIENRWLSKSN